jgi:indole-3-glycerol phosphate synthase
VSFLDDTLRRKRDEVEARRRAVSLEELAARAARFPARPSLEAALSPLGGPVRVIAEVKRASPSVGAIRPDASAEALAREYEAAGAAAISVLTDGPAFGGSMEDLEIVVGAVRAPVLRKDFVVDAYQIVEARAAGASAVLLIVAAQGDERLRELLLATHEAGLEALVECHDEREVDAALAAGARVVGVNSRDLRSLRVDLAVAERLVPRIGASAVPVAESGIRTADDVARLRRVGAASFLVGEALVRAADRAALLRSFEAAS